MPVMPAAPYQVAALKAQAARQRQTTPGSTQILDQIIARLSQPTQEEQVPAPPELSTGQKLSLGFMALDPQRYRDAVLPEIQRRDPQFQALQEQDARQGAQDRDLERLTALHGALANREQTALMAQEREAAAAQKQKGLDAAARYITEQFSAAMPGVMQQIAALEASGDPADAGKARALKTMAAKARAVYLAAQQDTEEGISANDTGLDAMQSALDDLTKAFSDSVSAENREAAAAAGHAARLAEIDARGADRDAQLKAQIEAGFERQRREQEHDRTMVDEKINAGFDRFTSGRVPLTQSDQNAITEKRVIYEMSRDLLDAYLRLGKPGGFGTWLRRIAAGDRALDPAEVAFREQLAAYNLEGRHELLGAAITQIESEFGRPVFTEIVDDPRVVEAALRGHVARTSTSGRILMDTLRRNGKSEAVKAFDGVFGGEALPADVPQGSVKVGTTADGMGVIYRLPDGREITWTPD